MAEEAADSIDDTIGSRIASNLKRIMLEKAMSSKELSEASGVPANSIIDMLRANRKRAPNNKTNLQSVASALHVSIEQLTSDHKLAFLSGVSVDDLKWLEKALIGLGGDRRVFLQEAIEIAKANRIRPSGQ